MTRFLVVTLAVLAAALAAVAFVLTWLGWVGILPAPAWMRTLPMAMRVSTVQMAYSVGLPAVVLQVLSLVVRHRLPKPRPVFPLLTLILVTPVLAFQIFCLAIFLAFAGMH